MGNQVVVQEKPVREQIREQKRNIERSVRNIEREKRRVEAEEKKVKGEIKKMAKAGQHKAAKMMARDIVRMKGQIEKMTEFCGQLKAVALRIGGIATLNELSNAMEEAGKAITTVSSKLDANKLAALAKNLSKEDSKLDMKQDMMQDILEGIGEGMDDPAEQERIYKQVLEEVGIEVSSEIPDANIKKPVKQQVKEENKNVAEEEDSLDEMLKQLQK